MADHRPLRLGQARGDENPGGECVYTAELDMQTLVWTRGRALPLSRLQSRLRCPKRGSREYRQNRSRGNIEQLNRNLRGRTTAAWKLPIGPRANGPTTPNCQRSTAPLKNDDVDNLNRPLQDLIAMPGQKPSCFISYCHDGADFDSIALFEEFLKKQVGNDIEVFIDKSKIRIGDKISDHEARIDTVDAVIILLTPQYATKVRDRSGGVYREYKKILARLQKSEESRRQPRRNRKIIEFSVLPLIFSGTMSDSCPEELIEHLLGNFVQFRQFLDPRGKKYVPNKQRAQFDPLFKQIADRIRLSFISKSESFSKTYDKLFNMLFLETKHENIQPNLSIEDEAAIYVKTRPYRQVKDQSAFILVGRKGSGKTTIARQLALEGGNQFDNIDVYVDDFQLEYLFKTIMQPQLFSDINSLQPQLKLFRAAWQIFIYTSAMITVAHKGARGLIDFAIDRKLARFSNQVLGRSLDRIETINYWAIFVWAFSKAADQIEKAIQEARPSKAEFFSDIARATDEQAIFESAIPKDVITAFQKAFVLRQKRLIVTIDGFDTKFAEFRMNTIRSYSHTETARTRNSVEFDYLRALLHVAVELKTGKKKSPFSNYIDFCLMIPKDRFLEIRNFERDAAVYRNKISDIFWSGFELFLMTRKRLESLASYETNDSSSLIERLKEVMRERFPEIPLVIDMEFHGETIRIETIIYILRHTFWRPRDILFYFGRLIAYRDELKKWGRQISSDLVRKAVSECTWDVVGSEFINEFQGYFTNIRDVVHKFMKCNQQLDYEELYSRIGRVGFEFANREMEVDDIHEKISVLYEIGFLGIMLDRDLVRSQKVSTDALFYFSDGDSIFRAIGMGELKQQKFLIHPVFCEWLNLRTNSRKMVLQYDWDYLKANDDALAVS